MDAYFLLAAIFIIVAGIIIGTIVHSIISKKKLAATFRRNFGKAPDFDYEDGDFEQMAEYYFYRLANNGDEFKIDDITWNDLNMDGILADMNATQTNCGAQVLYNTLRTPAFDKETFERRRHIIDTLDDDESLRVKLQLIFAGLSRRRNINICEEFKAQEHSIGAGLIYIALAALLIIFLVLTIISPFTYGPLLVLSLIVNSMTYSIKMRKSSDGLVQLNYTLSMIVAAKRIEKLASKKIEDYTVPLIKANKKLGSLSAIGSITMTSSGVDLSDILSMVILWDLIRYEISKAKLGAHYKELMTIFEVVGGLDCAISIASYRKRMSAKCRPEIDFDSCDAFAEAYGLVHPLINNAVPNDFDTHGSVLLTGSNASGKSTYLKTLALNAVFAQTVCFCTAQSYKASALRVYSSMALRDDLAAGESYYIVEIKSIGRIITAACSGAPVICIVDEVLRGTNTVERIAASSEILRYIASHGALCVAATHDIELASILKAEFHNYHFQEYIEDNSMRFDYKLREGPSTSRNAIKLLEIMGYDKEISQRATDSAEHFLKNGNWR